MYIYIYIYIYIILHIVAFATSDFRTAGAGTQATSEEQTYR